MSAPRTHPPHVPASAWLSFALGLASLLLCLLALTGVPAFVLGLRSLRAINLSDGRLRGARLAVAGMLLGGTGTVATVVGVAAILIHSGQHASHRVECIDHLRQIGEATNKYADVHGHFPAATQASKDLPPTRRLSWLSEVLPLLADGTPASATYQALAQELVVDRAWDDPVHAKLAKARLRIFVCPAKPNVPLGTTHYVGVAGVGVEAAELPRSDQRAGMFGYERGVRRPEVTAGISFTMMALETADKNGCWLAGGVPTVRGVDAEVEAYCGPGRAFGGLHAGMTNVLWVDGSVRQVKDDVPGDLLRGQVTIRRVEE